MAITTQRIPHTQANKAHTKTHKAHTKTHKAGPKTTSAQAIALSRDHTAALEDEKERVEQAGALVQWVLDGWRVGPAGMQVTRYVCCMRIVHVLYVMCVCIVHVLKKVL